MIEPLRAPDEDLAFQEARQRIRRDRRSVCDDLDGAFAYLEHALFDVELTLEDVARAAGMSVATLFRLFQRELDATPHGYVASHRLATAEMLLRASDLRIHEIAYRVGYESHQGFFEAFHHRRRETPLRFRARHRRLALGVEPT